MGSDEMDDLSAYDCDDLDGDGEGLSDSNMPDGSIQLARDKEWLDKFIKETMKSGITKVEHEIDNIRNKKIRGTTKKQKDMLKALNDKLKLMRSTKERCEELAMTMEFLEGGAIKTLKTHLKKYNEDHDNDTLRTNVDNEVQRLIELADKNRKDEDLLNQGGGIAGIGKDKDEEEKVEENSNDSSANYGYLGWLHKLVDLSKPENSDIYPEKKIAVEQLNEGTIVDVLDEYGVWHLSIICKIQPENEAEYVKINLFPYPKGNRDEWIALSEIPDRISGPFVNSESVQDFELEPVSKCLTSLRDYYQKFVAAHQAKMEAQQQASNKNQQKDGQSNNNQQNQKKQGNGQDAKKAQQNQQKAADDNKGGKQANAGAKGGNQEQDRNESKNQPKQSNQQASNASSLKVPADSKQKSGNAASQQNLAPPAQKAQQSAGNQGASRTSTDRKPSASKHQARSPRASPNSKKQNQQASPSHSGAGGQAAGQQVQYAQKQKGKDAANNQRQGAQNQAQQQNSGANDAKNNQKKGQNNQNSNQQKGATGDKAASGNGNQQISNNNTLQVPGSHMGSSSMHMNHAEGNQSSHLTTGGNINSNLMPMDSSNQQIHYGQIAFHSLQHLNTPPGNASNQGNQGNQPAGAASPHHQLGGGTASQSSSTLMGSSSTTNASHMMTSGGGVRNSGTTGAGHAKEFMGGGMASNPSSNNPQDEPFSDATSHVSSQPGTMMQGGGLQGSSGPSGGLLNQSQNPVQGAGFQGANSDMGSNDMSSAFKFGGSTSGGMFGGENPFQKGLQQSLLMSQPQKVMLDGDYMNPFPGKQQNPQSQQKPMNSVMNVMDNRTQMAGSLNAGGIGQQQMSIFSNDNNQSNNQNSLFSKNSDNYGSFGQEYQFQMRSTGTNAAPSLGSNATPQEKNLLLNMLNSSFLNIPLLQDQVGIDVSRTCPLPVEDSVYMTDDQEEQARIKSDIQEQRYFPTSAMYNRQSNFIKMDLDCLFFAFYYQQGTYQQYLAAQELKSRGWEFQTRFLTWMKKETSPAQPNRQNSTSRGAKQPKQKTLYFDFEGDWRVKVSASGELQLDDGKFTERDLIVPTTEVSKEMRSFVGQEPLTNDLSFGSTIRASEVPKELLDQLCK